MLAQLVEQRTFNPFVVGSTPAHPTKLGHAGIERLAITTVAGFIFGRHSGLPLPFAACSAVQAAAALVHTACICLGKGIKRLD